jgi:hypothetical protein
MCQKVICSLQLEIGLGRDLRNEKSRLKWGRLSRYNGGRGRRRPRDF